MPSRLQASVRSAERLALDTRAFRKHFATSGPPRSTWWDPMARGWWIGVLFAVGSVAFALGALPAYATGVGEAADGTTFFVGSLFFTTAAFFQYRESADSLLPRPPGSGRLRACFSRRPDRLGWWATVVQLAGTLLFNVSTAEALRHELTTSAADRLVWRPDAFGSACFLVASGLAWAEVCHGAFDWRPRQLSWWITLVNLVGSVAFGVSAVASYVVPSTGDLASPALTNLGTFVGGLCFLAGALLLLPERTEEAVPMVPAGAPGPGHGGPPPVGTPPHPPQFGSHSGTVTGEDW